MRMNSILNVIILLTLFILMNLSIHIDTIIRELFIYSLRGYR